jgi:hypothetical protein
MPPFLFHFSSSFVAIDWLLELLPSERVRGVKPTGLIDLSGLSVRVYELGDHVI